MVAHTATTTQTILGFKETTLHVYTAQYFQKTGFKLSGIKHHSFYLEGLDLEDRLMLTRLKFCNVVLSNLTGISKPTENDLSKANIDSGKLSLEFLNWLTVNGKEVISKIKYK